jgi:hypothetical protein
MVRLSADRASGCLMVHHGVVLCVFSGPLCMVAITSSNAWCFKCWCITQVMEASQVPLISELFTLPADPNASTGTALC